MAVAESGVTMTYMSAAQIAADLIRRIRAGEWKPDSPLPPFAELAQRYDCPESRIKHAMVRVGLSGAAEYRQGKGWYVRGGVVTDLVAWLRLRAARWLRRLADRVDPTVAVKKIRAGRTYRVRWRP